MDHVPPTADLTHDELEIIQELEQALSGLKERHIVLIAYDLGDDAGTYSEDDFDVSATPAP